MSTAHLEFLIKKYQEYKYNLQYHLDVNKPTGNDLLLTKQRVEDYTEIIKDLKRLL